MSDLLVLPMFQDTASASRTLGDDQSDSFETELRQYLGVTVNQDATTFDFWRKHEIDLPVLSVMAKIYLALSPGSVPVECLV